MASLDFPSNPVDQQQYTLNGIVYYYNASVGAWLTVLTSKLSDTSSNTQVMFNDAGISNGSPGLVYNKVANTLTVRNIISTGNVGIGTTSPTSKLDVDGAINTSSTVTLAAVPNYRNTPNIASNYTISNTYNEMSIGPINIANNVTVTVDNNASWVII
jgi:hypothetical protein